MSDFDSPLAESAPPQPDADGPGSGAALLAKVIEAELRAEETRKASIEGRGNSVITTSGGLVTVLFALAALVTDDDTYTVPGSALVAVLASLLLFVGAAVLGLLTSAVKNYARVKIEDVERTVKSDWLTITSSEAQSLIANNNLAVLKSARETTNDKARLLKAAVGLEVAAVTVLAVAVAIILGDAL